MKAMFNLGRVRCCRQGAPFFRAIQAHARRRFSLAAPAAARDASAPGDQAAHIAPDTSKKITTEEYFLAGRDTQFWAVGLALFASNIGSEHFVGLAGSGAKLGMCVSWGEWLSPLCILLLGWVFVPYYLRTDIYTMPEFLEQRYSRGLRVYYALLLLVMYVFTKVSVALYAGAIVLQLTLGWDIMTSAVILVVATGAYTTLGGMKAVIHTECLQSVVLIAGGLLLLGYALQHVGGGGLVQGGAALWRQLPDSHLHLFQPPSHHEFPWTGVLFGMPFTSIWYWCTDQNVVQRVLAAKSLAHARAGAVLAASLKILPPFMMVVPGMVARVLYRQQMEDSEEVGWPARLRVRGRALVQSCMTRVH